MSEGTAFGAIAAILVMALATYLCRISGYFAMNVIRLTPRVRRGLAALPGCIVVATVLPVVERLGPVAFIAILAGLAAMIVLRRDVLALAVGMAAAVALRAAGI